MPLQVTQPNQTPVKREPLRWLFTAHFSDGTAIVQDQDDESTTRPGNGSTFTDVLAREDELVAFELRHTNETESVLVDLKTGAFLVNSTPLVAHNQYFEAWKYPLKLVYFREARIDAVQESTVQEDGSIKLEMISARQYANRYFIGWETVVHGKNKQVTLAVG